MYVEMEGIGVAFGAGVTSDRRSLRAAGNTATDSVANRAVLSVKPAIDQALSERSLVS